MPPEYLIDTMPTAPPLRDQLHGLGIEADAAVVQQCQVDLDLIRTLRDDHSIDPLVAERGIKQVLDQLRATVRPRPSTQVRSPSHYTTGGIEAIDYIRAKLGPDGFRAYCLGNVLKYVSRWQHKDGATDLQKALVYMRWAADETPDAGIPSAREPAQFGEPILPHNAD